MGFCALIVNTLDDDTPSDTMTFTNRPTAIKQHAARMNDERTTLRTDQPETNHKPRLAPVAVHTDLRPLVVGVGVDHFKQQQPQQED